MSATILNYAKLGPNIRGLRESFGETQLDLAYAIGLNSTGAIANYEKLRWEMLHLLTWNDSVQGKG